MLTQVFYTKEEDEYNMITLPLEVGNISIGCKINEKDLWKEEKIRGCEHPIIKKSKKCHVCNKPAWVWKKVPKSFYNPTLQTIEGVYLIPTSIKGVFIFPTINFKSDIPDIELAMSVNNIDKKKIGNLTKRKLEPLGLWKASKFSVWRSNLNA